MSISNKTFLAAISLLVVVAVSVAARTFLFRQDYEFIVEAPCDPAETTCFFRDCSEEECPPNELGSYRIFAVRADDFPHCSDNSCLAECLAGTIECTEYTCGESEEDICAE